ncbi:MAG: hypothetical protein WAL97_09610 [Halobacteriota archaeon]|jgi:hypothetical protein
MTHEQACYYGLRVGCPNATNPNCRLCAERLARAVNQMLRPMTTSDADASRSAGASIGDDGTDHILDLSSPVLSYARERS